MNKLCEAVMHDDEGLLQQFVEYMINPVIANAIHLIKDEQSWKQASQSLPSSNSCPRDHADLDQSYIAQSYLPRNMAASGREIVGN